MSDSVAQEVEAASTTCTFEKAYMLFGISRSSFTNPPEVSRKIAIIFRFDRNLSLDDLFVEI